MPAVLGALAFASGCGDLGPGLDGLAGEVDRQRQIWEAHAPDAYVVELERLCFCGEAARGPVRVTIQGGGVVSRVYVASGDTVPQEFSDLFPPVDGLFDILQEAVDRPAANVDVTWDPIWGSPATFFIDYSVNIADEELGFRVTSGPR